MTFGNMGGSVQPETHAQHMINLIDLGMNVQMTSDAARFTHGQGNNVLSLHTRIGEARMVLGTPVIEARGGLIDNLTFEHMFDSSVKGKTPATTGTAAVKPAFELDGPSQWRCARRPGGAPDMTAPLGPCGQPCGGL